MSMALFNLSVLTVDMMLSPMIITLRYAPVMICYLTIFSVATGIAGSTAAAAASAFQI